MRKSDLSTFFEDLAAVRPTVMLLIPRLANMMYDKLVGQLEQAPEGGEDAKAAYKQACIFPCCWNLPLTGGVASWPWRLSCQMGVSFEKHGLARDNEVADSQAVLFPKSLLLYAMVWFWAVGGEVAGRPNKQSCLLAWDYRGALPGRITSPGQGAQARCGCGRR